MSAVDNNMPYEVWDNTLSLPRPGQVPDLRVMTHVTVHRAVPGEFQFLHESSIAVFDGKLVAAWANDPVDENSAEGVVRASWSTDGGYTWSKPQMVGPGFASPEGLECDNHVTLHSHEGRLYAYASRWLGGLKDDDNWHPLPSMRAVQFVYDIASDSWSETGVAIPRFLMMHGPQPLPGGGWIMAGEYGFSEPAVAICEDDAFNVWATYPITTRRILKFPEPTIIVEPNRLVAIIRNSFMLGPAQDYGLVSESLDNGRTWSEAKVGNLPMVDSKPFGGILSTDQRYLIFNYPDPRSRRGNLVIGVSRPGSDKLSLLRTIRQGVPPVQLEGLCKDPQWSYPYAIEHEGKLLVTYSISKEDCAMTIIPLNLLQDF